MLLKATILYYKIFAYMGNMPASKEQTMTRELSCSIQQKSPFSISVLAIVRRLSGRRVSREIEGQTLVR
jgi:hypothetical protein